MAEGLFRKLTAGLKGITVESAGLSAASGQPVCGTWLVQRHPWRSRQPAPAGACRLHGPRAPAVQALLHAKVTLQATCAHLGKATGPAWRAMQVALRTRP